MVVFIVFLTSLWIGPTYRDLSPEVTTPQLSVPYFSEIPTLDDFSGMTASPRVSGHMVTATGFSQRHPHDGRNASQRTEVYLSHDEKNLYAVFLAFDQEPHKVRHSLAPRESIGDDDTVSLVIDTFNDQRRAYTFTCNPRGVQRDSIFTEGSGEDSSFNTVWRSEGRLTEGGFIVRMVVPFKSLRFPPEREQVWGVMFSRSIIRLSEDSHWPRYLRAIQGKLNQAGRLRIDTKITSGKNHQFIPFVTARSFELLENDPQEGPRFISDDNDAKIGLDAKFVFKESMVLDLTANPDFSQVESDQPQIVTNNRFETFFPERRPFFIENSDIFKLPIRLVFTRRIIEPEGGIRLTGKSGPYAIGALIANDKAPGQIHPNHIDYGHDANYGIARLTRDVFSQSRIGMLYTHRELNGRRNDVASVDGRFTLNANWTAQVQAVHSRNDELDADEGAIMELEDEAYYALFVRDGRNVTTFIRYVDVGEDFRAPTGFLGRVYRPDNRNVHTFTTLRSRPENGKLDAWGLNLSTENFWDQDGTPQEENFSPNLVWQFEGQTTAFLYGSIARETLRPVDFPALTERTKLEFWHAGASITTSIFKKFSLDTYYEQGETPNFVRHREFAPNLGTYEDFNLSFIWRPITRFRLDQDLLYFKLDNKDNDAFVFSNLIYRTKLNWQFNRHLSARLIAQYESLRVNEQETRIPRGRDLNGDLLLTYLVNPWTAFYLGYNSNYINVLLEHGADRNQLLLTEDLHNDSHQVFMKFSYLWR
ncbi:Carbohydrate binding family 9 domain-containing protein [Sulfidibacter corallicola]|uniref:Carbohydrate binding family 9 domain-containing protein n=1 Tax=Sulfidibacter corallicola TaxID=2818388 RepID=A0A8A4TYW4_SULCO|nr:carbohydrate binding family 9 domain-containing protein [Sulfidibacter corallicola]QTD54142.1 carbohydrate binding family 9 domain-containing protein [Sulfidibacter corallicola]